ncbi:hypothetical protein [Paractinoplanes toevensis]|uniref:Uncharacterized protein n=1 Tax=Paractinoplanes toevensis TaxID=571911 RepID=A0A919W071_9ACTN|nr:hypothetical protein [Actinoplanes toevensis]GIM88864.1 hypothetical protein Ato02nite_006570 [Actinoplanes toevensis]
MSDETFTINGVTVTARLLAMARNELARTSVFNAGFIPRFDQLTEHEQTISVLDAGNYLKALARIVPGVAGEPT